MPNADSPTTARQAPRATRRLATAIEHALGMRSTDDGFGFVLAELRRAALREAPHLAEPLARVIDACVVARGRSIDLDRYRVLRGDTALGNLWSSLPGLDQREAALLRERTMRLILHAVARNRQIAPELETLRQAIDRGATALLRALTLPREDLPVAHSNTRDGAARALLERMHHALVDSLAPPAPRPAPAAKPPREPLDLVERKLLATRYLSPAVRAGSAAAAGLLPHQLDALAAAVKAALPGPSRRHALTLVLFAQLGSGWAAALDVPIVHDARLRHGPAGIDVARGAVLIALQRIADLHRPRQQRRRRRYDRLKVRSLQLLMIPLPVEVADELRALLRERPEAESLNALLGGSAWISAVRQFLSGILPAPWRITNASLCQGLPRLLLQDARDEAAIEAAFCLAGVVPSASWHYMAVDPGRLAVTVAHFARSMGLSGELAFTPTRLAALHPRVPPAQARRTVIDLAARINARIADLRPVQSLAESCAIVNDVAVWTATIFVLVEGHRCARIEWLCRSNVCFELRVVYVADKYRRQVRPVPLAPLVQQHLEAYLALLKSIAYRVGQEIEHIQKELQRAASLPSESRAELDRLVALAEAVEATLDPGSNRPLFIRIVSAVEPLRSGEVAATLRRMQLRRNDGRCYLSDVMREAGLGVSDENAVAGRGDGPLAAFGPDGATAPVQVCGRVREVLEAAWPLAVFPGARILAGRDARAPHRIGRTRTAPPRERRPTATYPFRLRDGYRLSRLARLTAKLKHAAPDNPWSALAVTAIVEHLLCRVDELKAVIETGASSRLPTRRIGQETVVVLQYGCDALGLREILICDETLQLLGRLPQQAVDGELVLQDLDRSLAALVPGMDLDELLDCAHAAAAYLLPGVFREVVVGRCTMRTATLLTHRRAALACEDAT